MENELNAEDKERIEQEALEALWEKMSREDWLAGEGFSGKFDGLSRVPFIFKKRIFEFAAEYATIYEREKQVPQMMYANDTILKQATYIRELEAGRTELIEYNNNLEKTLRICLTVKPHTESVDAMKAMVKTLLENSQTK